MPSRSERGRKRRPRGSVYLHKASGRWCAQTPPDPRGRRRTRYFAGEDAAWRWLDEQLEKLDVGLDMFAGAETLGAYLRRWVERGAADPELDWSPSTARQYRWAVGRAEPIAHIALEDLSRDRVETLLADLAREDPANAEPSGAQVARNGAGRQRATRLRRHGLGAVRSVLRAALEDLVDDGIIDRNPARRRRRGRHADEEEPVRVPWSEDDARSFLQTARRSPRFALWWLVVSCGLRNGELRGLVPADLDLGRGLLTVRDQADQSGRRLLGRTKTRRSRTIGLPSNVVAALRAHYATRAALHGRLFARDDGRPLSGSDVLDELRALRVEAGVPPIGRVHDLRHVAASLMLANGYPVVTVAQILGHRKPSTTHDVYAHIVPEKPIERPRNMAAVLPFVEAPRPVGRGAGRRRAVRPAVGAGRPFERRALLKLSRT